jgi:preprotein translocase subunit SecF
VELFTNPNINFMRWKWRLAGVSLALVALSLVSLLGWRGIPLGVDFRGGTIVTVKFAERVPEDQVRSLMNAAGLPGARIQRYGPVEANEMLISLEQQEGDTAEALDRGRQQIIAALHTGAPEGKQDLNNSGVAAIQDSLLRHDPLRLGLEGSERYAQMARQLAGHRDRERGGVLGSFADVSAAIGAAAAAALESDFYLSNFVVRNVDIVGPQVGAQLRRQAMLAVLYSLIGMLVYLWFRFELVYGVAAVVAVAHDALVTVGAFSLTGTEISLTVIAALLTLVGYSMNDTIVIFDRVRENLKTMRRESLEEIVNRSMNQTLSRTVLTSGLTFLAVLSMFLFGGEVLYGFSFALVVGILVGTYSTIAVAAPFLVITQQWRAQREGRGRGRAGADSGRKDKEKEKVRAKA